MAERYTVKDVRAAFERAVKCATAAGLDTEGWHLQEGSKTYGQAFRIFRRDPQGGGLRDLGFTSGNGYLGMTCREANDMLHAYASAWWAVVDAREGRS